MQNTALLLQWRVLLRENSNYLIGPLRSAYKCGSNQIRFLAAMQDLKWTKMILINLKWR